MSVDKSKVLIQVQDLKKTFGSNQVLDGISTDICQGEVVAIIGPSGSGKSTFLRSLNLLEVPTGGKILFEGTDITDPKVDINLHRQKIGMVFQQFNLFPHKTVKQNIMMAPVALKMMTTEEASKRADELLVRVGLPDKADAYPDMLSGGQKQRVAIAGVIAMEPKCIVLDEPTAMLDPNGRKEVIEAVEQLRKEKNVTVILITHYMEEVEILCDRIIILDKGKILAEGTSDELKKRANIEEKITVEVNNIKSDLINDIKKFNTVDDVFISENVLHIVYKKGKNNLGELIDYFKEHKISYNSIFSERPTLNDVFLELTGKGLRD